MTSTIAFEKSGQWTSFCGPIYTVVADGQQSRVTIYGAYCHPNVGHRCRKTKHYTVLSRCGGHYASEEIGSSFTLKGAQEIARRAVASIGYTTKPQDDGTIAVFDASGVKVYEATSYYTVRAKFPSALRSA
jgi:hypothetical protein